MTGRLRAAIGLGLITALVLLGVPVGPASPRGGPAVTWGAAGLIGLGYYLAQSAWLAGLGYWTLYRPLVAGAVVGVVLGDPWAGARVGATLNIALLGFLGTGGALPTDAALVGFVGATVSVATGLSAAASLALTLPLGALGYGLYRLRLHWADTTARRAAHHARRGDARSVARYSALVPQLRLLLLAWAPGTAAAWLLPAAARWLVASTPPWVTGGLEVAGALLVALGAAAGLSLVWTRRTAACFLGAVAVAAAASTPAAIWGGLAGAIVALAVPWLAAGGGRESVVVATGQGARPEGAADARPPGAMRRRDLAATLLTWLFFSHSAYGAERRQAVGLAHAMAPALRRLYPDRAELGRALARYLSPFNVEPNLGSALLGVLVHQEEALAAGLTAPGAPEEARAQLAGPVSGVGDTVIHGAVGTLALAAGVAIASVAGPLGAILYCALMASVVWGVSVWSFQRGYRGGLPALLRMLRGAAWRRVVVGAEHAGAIVLGVITAGPVAAALASVPIGAAGAAQGVAGRALSALPALALVLAFLALQRWRVRGRLLAVACYAIGAMVTLVRLP